MSTTARTANGDIALPRVIVTDLASCVRQSILDGLGLWLGEWFLDTNAGFPWLQKILGVKTPDPARLGQLITSFILGVQGVATCTANATYDGQKRAFFYSFTATLDNGQILTRNTNGEFNVTGNAA